MGQRPQIMIRTEQGESDFSYYIEQLEKRIKCLEERVSAVETWVPQADLGDEKVG